MELVNWACQPVSTGDRKFWSMVEDQIRFNAEKWEFPQKRLLHIFLTKKIQKNGCLSLSKLKNN